MALTIPLALFMGIYLRYLRPGRVGEISLIGLVFLFFAITTGDQVQRSAYASWFTYDQKALTLIIVCYGFIAAVLPV